MVWQVREAAARAGVHLAGENALPCFSPNHIDDSALERIVYNTRAWGPPLQARPCSTPLQIAEPCNDSATCLQTRESDPLRKMSHHEHKLPVSNEDCKSGWRSRMIPTHQLHTLGRRIGVGSRSGQDFMLRLPSLQEETTRREVFYGASSAPDQAEEDKQHTGLKPDPGWAGLLGSLVLSLQTVRLAAFA